MRLTRDFSGKHRSAGSFERAKPPAYAKALKTAREAGQRVGLLLVSVDDWHGGELFADRPGVFRVVVAEDADPAALDWSLVVALDCLVCGAPSFERMTATLLALFQHGAASVWGEFQSGIWQVHPCPLSPGWVCGLGPVVADSFQVRRFNDTLRLVRELALIRGEGIYAGPMFQPAREAALAGLGLDAEGNPFVPPVATHWQREAARDGLIEARMQASAAAQGHGDYAAAREAEARAQAVVRDMEAMDA